MVKKTHIVIHHSISEDHPLLVNFQDIRDYHVNVNKWRDVGYNFVLDKINNRTEIFVGRMLTETGAHTIELGLNKVGIGICVIGDYDEKSPSEESIDVLGRLCRSLMEEFLIPYVNVIGHWEAQMMGGLPPSKRKTCPGKMFNMDMFRQKLKI